jgi:hypothetical protein
MANNPNLEELKKIVEELKSYAKVGPAEYRNIEKSVEKVISKMNTMSDIPKEVYNNIAEIVVKFKDAEKAINKFSDGLSSADVESKNIVGNIIDAANEIEESLEGLSKTLGIHQKIKEALREQTEEIVGQGDVDEKIKKTKEGQFDFITKTKQGLSSALSILRTQLSEHSDILAILKLSNGTYTEFMETLKSGGSATEKLVEYLESQKHLHKENLDIVEDLIKNYRLSIGLQYQQYKIQREYADIVNDTKKDVGDMYMKYAMLSKVVPLIGDRLSKSFMKANLIAQDALDTAYDVFKETGSVYEAAGAGLDKLVGGFGSLATGFLMIGAVLVGVYKLFSDIDNKVGEISERTGLSADQSYELYKSSLQVNTAYGNQLSSLDDILSVQSQLVNETGKQLDYSESILGKVSDMSVVFGYNADTAGKLHNTFLQLSGAMPLDQAEELSAKMQYMLGSMAEAHGIAPGIVARDLVENSEFLAKNFAGMPEEAMRAAVEVRRLGYSLGQAAKVSDHLFDIQGSLTAQMEASVGLGRLVDMNAARRYAMTGETAKMMEELSKQMGTYTDFQNLSVAQRMLLADAAGMEVSEVQRSLYLQQQLAHLSSEERENIANNLKDVENITSLNADQLKIASDNVNKTKEFDIAMGKVKMALIDAILPAAEALVPLIGVLAKTVSLLVMPLKLIKVVFDSIGFVVKSIGDGIKNIVGADLFRSFYESIVGVDEKLSGLPDKMSNLQKSVVGGLGIASLVALPKLLRGRKSKSNSSSSGGILNKMSNRLFGTGNQQVSLLTQIRNILSGKGGLGGLFSGSGKSNRTGGIGGNKPSTFMERIFGKTYKKGQFLPGGGRATTTQKVGGLLPKIKNFAMTSLGGVATMSKKILGKTASFGQKIITKAPKLLGKVPSLAKGIATKLGPLGAAIDGFISIGKGTYNVATKEALSGGKGGSLQTVGNIVSGIGAEFVNGLDKLTFGSIDKLADSLNLGIKGIDISQTEQLRAAYRSMTGEQIGVGKEGNEKLLEWAEKNASYLSNEGGLKNVITDLDFVDKIQSQPIQQPLESISSIKEDMPKDQSFDLASLNNNIKEMVNMQKMAMAKESNIYLRFDDGTVRKSGERSRKMGMGVG